MYQVILVSRETGKLECAVSEPILNLYLTLQRVESVKKFYCTKTYAVMILRYQGG